MCWSLLSYDFLVRGLNHNFNFYVLFLLWSVMLFMWFKSTFHYAVYGSLPNLWSELYFFLKKTFVASHMLCSCVRTHTSISLGYHGYPYLHTALPHHFSFIFLLSLSVYFLFSLAYFFSEKISECFYSSLRFHMFLFSTSLLFTSFPLEILPRWFSSNLGFMYRQATIFPSFRFSFTTFPFGPFFAPLRCWC